LKNIGIIILNWQGWKDTIACLESLKKLRYARSISLIVCDNYSTNDSYHQILNWAQQHYTPSEIGVFFQEKIKGHTSQFFPFILIQTGANLGFAGGNNVGIRYALATQQYEYLWLLNNDTVVDTNALSALHEYAIAHPNIALIGSTVIDYYQRDTVQCAGGCHYSPLLTIVKRAFGGQPLKKVIQHSEAITLDYVFGAAMFLPIEVVQKIGFLNEEYFLFYEELDYTQRLKRQGYGIGWCKNSLVYHKGSASVGSVHDGDRDKLRRANYYENLSTLKYTANFYPRLLPLVMILRFIGKSLALISRRDFYLFAPLFKAYRDFISKSL
jgi:GT2 family glycosyltransferase